MTLSDASTKPVERSPQVPRGITESDIFFSRASLWIHVRITFLRGEFFIKISVFSFAEYWCGTQWTSWYWTLQVGKSWIGDTTKSKKTVSVYWVYAIYGLFTSSLGMRNETKIADVDVEDTYMYIHAGIYRLHYMFLGNVYSCLYSLLILKHLFVPWLSLAKRKQGSMSFNPFRDLILDCCDRSSISNQFDFFTTWLLLSTSIAEKFGTKWAMLLVMCWKGNFWVFF